MLTWSELCASRLRLLWLSLRIAFHRKLAFMAGGIVVYYGILYAFATFRPAEGFSVVEALFVLVEIPGAVLAIYLTMDLVAGERDRNTLEVLFATSSSHYRIWAFRLGCVFVILGLSLQLMSAASYVLFAELPVVAGAWNAFLPAAAFASLTFCFSVIFRSSNAAGMGALGCLMVVLLSHGALSGTAYAVFLSPFDIPMGTSDALWDDRILLNRIGVLAAGVVLAALGLRGMERRERLLK
jgi:ABC-type transport system involved in multi-copper enzyme maturation permease subunit